jgi:OmpA-OmpF porin, OOP family
MRVLSVLHFLVLASSIAIVADVKAQNDAGPYLGISLGAARADFESEAQALANDIVALGFSSATVTVDQGSVGFKVLGGYQVNQNFALEAYYAHLGTYDIAVGTTGPATSLDGEVEFSAIGFDVLGIIPFDRAFSGFAKVGLFRWDGEISFSGPGGTASASDDGTDFKFGLGVQWKFSPNLNLRGEWEYYNIEETPIQMLSVGLVYRF